VRLLAALLLAALVLSGCETTAEKSAKLEAAAKRSGTEESAGSTRGLSIAARSRVVKVTATTVLHSSEGAAVVVGLRNDSASALRDVPIEITVRDDHGRPIYANTQPGLGQALTSAPLIGAHASLTWIDDQIQAAGTPRTAEAKVGESAPAAGAIPELTPTGTHLVEDPSTGPGVSGTVLNRSAVTQRELVVYAVARRGSRVVAAGRAVLPEAPGRASTPFQLFFIGDPRGGRLELSAPATTLR
jgi:hypothetical protein